MSVRADEEVVRVLRVGGLFTRLRIRTRPGVGVIVLTRRLGAEQSSRLPVDLPGCVPQPAGDIERSAHATPWSPSVVGHVARVDLLAGGLQLVDTDAVDVPGVEELLGGQELGRGVAGAVERRLSPRERGVVLGPGPGVRLGFEGAVAAKYHAISE